MADANSWVLSTREFRLLWEQRDAAPYPAFAYDGPEHFDNGDLARLADKRLLAQLAAESTALKEAAFTAFTKPRYSFEILGAESSDTEREPTLSRIYSAWDGVSQSAFIARQAPGLVVSVGGDVTVTRVDFEAWTSRLVASLPLSGFAGRLPQDLDVAMDVENWLNTTELSVSPRARRDTAGAAFVHLPQAYAAYVTVQVGSIADGRRPHKQEIQIADVAGDGCYALVVDTPALAVGVDGKKLATLLNKAINATKKRHDAAVVSA
ncbi:hypothetical protein [Williamsia sp. CHRR-6]|uniref:hypothetical protein n=1 Tax=Williamsia sp. CHRR-6 TaxID=2835871 RepID=UPI001BDB152F|nr:hypothetical protein [Williamsia sp. CHRR-6]MBT0567152.1 hypothetical protein [Williamsia sp. CHRR-6]